MDINKEITKVIPVKVTKPLSIPFHIYLFIYFSEKSICRFVYDMDDFLSHPVTPLL